MIERLLNEINSARRYLQEVERARRLLGYKWLLAVDKRIYGNHCKESERRAEAEVHSRKHNRCQLCGRPRAFLRKFGVCRLCFRALALKGEIPGVMKSSW